VSTLVLPVGHYLGPVHPAPGAPPAHHLVRVGWDSHRLAPGAAVDTWALAHGTGAPGDTPWTRNSLLAAAAAAGIPDAAGELDRLVAAGLTVLVDPAAAAGFAAAHRLCPLLVGLGTPPEDTFEVLGIPGLPPSARVRPRTAEVWRWVGLWPDLASASAALDRAAAAAGTAPGGLSTLLEDVQVLVSASAAYLDVAGGGRPARRHDLPG
jgi:hypothetical protein